MYVDDNETGDTYKYRPEDEGWGRLPEALDEKPFFCARLADKMVNFW
jgi:hypothetical protein